MADTLRPKRARGQKSAARATRQRSFRLSAKTLDELDELARIRNSSANSMAEQLLNEGLRTSGHPMIQFRQGGHGQRRPALLGTRLYVWQVMATVREEGSVEAAAEYLGLSPVQVRACISYYADFQEEVDSYAEEEREIARREEERWRREREVLG